MENGISRAENIIGRTGGVVLVFGAPLILIALNVFAPSIPQSVNGQTSGKVAVQKAKPAACNRTGPTLKYSAC